MNVRWVRRRAGEYELRTVADNRLVGVVERSRMMFCWWWSVWGTAGAR